MECRNPIICKTHGFLCPLPQHANNVYRFLLAENPYDEDTTRDWFRICSGITKIEYTEGLHDNSLITCGPSGDYDDALSAHLEKLLLNLTYFTYTWGGFESFVDSLNLPECSLQRGKFNKVAYYLKTDYESEFELPEYYTILVTLLTNYIKETLSFNADKNIFNPSKCAGKSGEGLTLVYKIRNGFAHGAFEFGESEEYHMTKSYHTRIIHISCRIILLTTQMLLLAIYKEDKIEIERKSYLDDGEEMIPTQQFLLNLHLRNYSS